MHKSSVKSLLFGVAVGDALGVPVEFLSRVALEKSPVTDMIGPGTHDQPPGTWSDDSSLTFCLAEALSRGFDLHLLGRYFVKWMNENFWTARGAVFDIGIGTRQAIARLAKGVDPVSAGNTDASSNGNGSLMRISPLLFYLLDKPLAERFEITKTVSSLTHGHIRSVIACFYYLEFAGQLYEKKNKFCVYRDLQSELPGFLSSRDIPAGEISHFDRLLKQNIYELPSADIESDGYVLHTLEAGIWCLLTTNSFREAVLKAVNLGEDTDTIAAVTGALAGLLYGMEGIPETWVAKIARTNDIEDLAERLGEKNMRRRSTRAVPQPAQLFLNTVKITTRYLERETPPIG